MSLLMDALKRAEATKGDPPAEAGKGPFPNAGPTLTLEDTAPAPGFLDAPGDDAAAGRTPALDGALEASAAEELELVESSLNAPVHGAERSTQDPDDRREAANTLFAAKAATPSALRRRAPFLAVTGVLVLIGAGAGVYFWTELDKLNQSGSSLVARTGAVRGTLPPPRVEPLPTAAGPTAVPPPVAAANTPGPVESVPPRESMPAPAPQRSEPAPPAAIAATGSPPPEPLFRRKAASPSSPSTTPTPREAPRVGIVATPAASPAQLAHAAMLRGDRAAAERHYRSVLTADPRNVDALVGLASLALDRNDAAAAEHLYLSALEADPKSATAQAGLINLHGQRDPSFAESRLKVLLGNLSPGSPATAGVVFVLGNHYARQARWNEAQRAYFEAYSLDPANPDYQFNLAVTLEHLQKGSLALNFYRGALAAAGPRAASFDRQQAKDRIDALDAAAR